jgi:hypothetical protein
LAGVLAGAAGTGWLLRRQAARLAMWSANRRVRALVLGEAPSARLYALLLARAGVRVEWVPDVGRSGGAPGLSMRLRGRLLPGLARSEADVALQTLDVALAAEYDLVLAALQDADDLACLVPLAAQGPLALLRESPLGLEDLSHALGEVGCLLMLPGYLAAEQEGVLVALPTYGGVATLGESDGAMTQRLRQAVSVLRRAHISARAAGQMPAALVGHAERLLALRDAAEGLALATADLSASIKASERAESAYRQRLMAVVVGEPEQPGPGRSARSTTALAGTRLLATLPGARAVVTAHLAAACPWLEAWAAVTTPTVEA